LGGARLMSGRLHSHRQAGSMLHLNNDEQKALWDKWGDAEAVIPADPYKAILPPAQRFTGWSGKTHQ